MESLFVNRTKIHGIGVKDILKQAEIKGDLDFKEGVLKIELASNRSLVVSNESGVLNFYIESDVPHTVSTKRHTKMYDLKY